MRSCCALLWVLLVLALGICAAETAEGLLQRGVAAAKAGHLEEAAGALREGRRLFPKDPRFAFELAGLAYREKQFSAAKRLLERGLQLAPSDEYGNDFLGTLFQIDGNLPAALKYWNRIGKPFLGRVVFQPDPSLNPVLRDRLFDFSAGQVLTGARLDETEANAERASVLDGFRIDLIGAANGRYDAIVQAQPIALPLTGWLGRLLPVFRELPYQQVDVDFYDVHGSGSNFTSLWRWDSNKRRIFLRVASPVHGNPRIERQIWLDGRDEIWDFKSGPVTLKRAAAGFGFQIGLSPKLQWTVGGSGSYRMFNSRPDLSPVFQKGALMSVNNRFDYALWRVPEHRLKTDAWAGFDAGRIIASAASRLTVARGGVEADWFPEAKGDAYRLTFQAQSGAISGNAPLDQLFDLGMDRDTEGGLWLRGLTDYTNGQKGNGLLGRDYAIQQTTLERRFFHVPMLTFTAGPFFDAGWTTAAGTTQIRSGANATTGVQAKLHTVGGIVLTAVYGRDLSTGRGTFFTAVSR